MSGPGATSAISPRPFTVSMKTPDTFSWEKIVDPVYRGLRSQGIDADDSAYHSVISHYSHLIRIASWEKGIDWVPASNQITLVVPNELNRHHQLNEKAGHYVDGLSVLLAEILQSISLETLLSFFPRE